MTIREQIEMENENLETHLAPYEMGDTVVRNIERFFRDYCCERYQILLNRRRGQQKPWTPNPIFQEWSFTNVKRSDDRTTIELRRIYAEHSAAPPEQQLLNPGIYRYFGTAEFARAVGWQETFNPEHLKNIVEERQAKKLRVYTGAYMIHANPGDRRPKHIQIIKDFLAPFWSARKDLCRLATEGSWQKFVRRLQQVKGFGGTGFMAKEVTLDTFLTTLWPEPPRDLNTWTAIGPGARRGVARILGWRVQTDVPEGVCLQVIKQIYALRRKYWPAHFPDLELHDIQFCLCEWDKFERVRLGEGKPKRRYSGLPV
jgi:hypothetical protein